MLEQKTCSGCRGTGREQLDTQENLDGWADAFGIPRTPVPQDGPPCRECWGAGTEAPTPIHDFTASDIARSYTISDGVLMSIVEASTPTVIAMGYTKNMTRATGRVAWIFRDDEMGWLVDRGHESPTARAVARVQAQKRLRTDDDLGALVRWLRGEQ